MAQKTPFGAYQNIFSNCCRALGTTTWGRVLAELDETSVPETFAENLFSIKEGLALPDWIPDLARIEWARHQLQAAKTVLYPEPIQAVSVNPSLSLVPVSWKHLVALMEADPGESTPQPEMSNIHVIVWRHPQTDQLHICEAADVDLLALKIGVEQIDPRDAASMGNVNAGIIHAAIRRAVARGYLLAPGSSISRKALSPEAAADSFKPFRAVDTFTLQWHITQACDLHCKHCYDRSERSPMPYASALAILEDFYGFCRQMHVHGQVTFTGGNPFLYPRFHDLYRAAFDMGFGLAVLGNPTPIDQVRKMRDIAMPSLFQISLEGLAEHNDDIRGKGHFHRSLKFLDDLRDLGIYSMVMLTLTRDNLDQVLPLAELLENRTDAFNFNRLSTVGEGAQLAMAGKAAYEAFLREYQERAEKTPMLGLKENLLNVIREERGLPLFGGCTGFGCGAAFNFVSLLPDGDVHACRKFPSRIGNMMSNSLMEIHSSDLAQRYRNGGQACRDCRLWMVCRGCMAVTHSHGLDVFEDKDPFCFVSNET